MTIQGMPWARPATQLEGLELDGGWVVIQHLKKSPYQTGGNFSESYLVERKGVKAFLKALDLSDVNTAPDPARELEAMLKAFNFERDILEKCKNHRLDRVALPVGSGFVRGSIIPVPYLIFDLADGDVRKRVHADAGLDLAWKLRSLHHIAVGLQQLHRHKFAHQDLKPSNVLVYAGNQSKLGDLGRAAELGNPQPHDSYQIAGDPNYAPPEQLYGFGSRDWQPRCNGCDIYHLGSMLIYFFTGAGATAQLLRRIHPAQRPAFWGGSYAEVLTYLRDAFDQMILDFRNNVDESVRADLEVVARQLCDPDPDHRGHPRDRIFPSGNPFSVERYVSRFDLLARRAEFGLKGKLLS